MIIVVGKSASDAGCLIGTGGRRGASEPRERANAERGDAVPSSLGRLFLWPWFCVMITTVRIIIHIYRVHGQQDNPLRFLWKQTPPGATSIQSTQELVIDQENRTPQPRCFGSRYHLG